MFFARSKCLQNSGITGIQYMQEESDFHHNFVKQIP
jgi:hypothetical protein